MLLFWFVVNTIIWPFNIKIGEMKLSFNVVALVLVGLIWIAMRMRVGRITVKVFLFSICCGLFTFAAAIAGPCNQHLQKLIVTLPVLFSIVAIGFDVGRRASTAEWIGLTRAVKIVLLVAFCGFVMEMTLPMWFPSTSAYRAEGKLSGIFSEPSQVAIALFPCIGILLVAENKRARQQGFVALIGLMLLSRSSSLIALTAAWIIYRLVVQKKLRTTIHVVLAMVLIFAFGAVINYDGVISPTIGKIVGVAAPGETNNLSSLIYVQGWQDAWFNLNNTHGLGLGFNLMGCGALPDVPARTAALLVTRGLELNGEDGSFVFAKTVSEFGVLGIVFYLVLIIWWFRLEKKLRILRNDRRCGPASTQAALIFCFIATSFVRGSGYFEGWFLLMAAATGGASVWQQSTCQEVFERT